jgi:hypothetical protein
LRGSEWRRNSLAGHALSSKSEHPRSWSEPLAAVLLVRTIAAHDGVSAKMATASVWPFTTNDKAGPVSSATPELDLDGREVHFEIKGDTKN